MNISTTNKTSVSKFVFHVAQIYLYLMVSNLLIASTVFMFGGTIGKYLLPLSFVVAIILTGIFYDGKVGCVYFYEAAVSIVLFCVLTYWIGEIYDNSWDGNTYHKLAVGLLKNHWNPMDISSSRRILESILQIKSNSGHFIWVEGYPKATWIFGASIYIITENIECGKVYTIIAMFCVFAFTNYYLKMLGKSKRFCFLFSLAAALNPIAVTHLRSFYVDGYLHLILYILVLSLIMNADKKHTISSKISKSLIASAMIVCGNIKFTGLFYGGVFCIAYYVWYCAVSFIDKKKDLFQKCLKSFCLLASLGIVTIFWAGSSAYYTNLVNHNTLMYPLTGNNPRDIITNHLPFPNANHFKNFIISLYSKMDNFFFQRNPERTPELKIPFTIYDEEIKIWRLSEIANRISGFGIWFSGIFTLSIIAILIKLFCIKEKRQFFFLMMNLFVNFFLCFFLKESWWARYAPQIYFIALIGFFIVLNAKKSVLIECLFSLIIIINSFFFLAPFTYLLQRTPKTQTIFNAAQQLEKVFIAPNDFEGVYFNLIDAKINYVIDESLNKKKSPVPYANLNLYFHEGVNGFVLEKK